MSARGPEIRRKHRRLYQFPISWAKKKVMACVRSFRMRSTPDEYLVEVDIRVIAVLECEGKIGTQL